MPEFAADLPAVLERARAADRPHRQRLDRPGIAPPQPRDRRGPPRVSSRRPPGSTRTIPRPSPRRIGRKSRGLPPTPSWSPSAKPVSTTIGTARPATVRRSSSSATSRSPAPSASRSSFTRATPPPTPSPSSSASAPATSAGSCIAFPGPARTANGRWLWDSALVPGPLTYPRSTLPANRTGAADRADGGRDRRPFLAPQAHRGRRNEPAFVAVTAAALAAIKGLSDRDVRRITTRNACALFRLPCPTEEPRSPTRSATPST